MGHFKLILLVVVFFSATTLFAERNKISKISIQESKGKVDVNVFGTQKPTFTIFKLKNPLRLIVDISNADINGIESPIEVNNGVIKQIITSQFEDDVNVTSRIMLSLQEDSKYVVKSVGSRFVLSLESETFKGNTSIVKNTTESNNSSDFSEKEQLFIQKIKEVQSDLIKKQEALYNREVELQKKERELQSLKGELTKAATVLETKKSENEKLEKILAEKNLQLSDKNSTISLLEKQLKNNSGEIQKNQSEINRLNIELKQSNQTITETSKIKLAIKELEKQKEQLLSQKLGVSKEIDSLLKEKESISKEQKKVLEKYNVQKKDYQILTQKYSKLEEENQKAKDEFSKISSQNETLIAENSKLKRQLSEIISQNNELMKGKSSTVKLAKENNLLKEQLDKLIEKNEALSKLSTERTKKNEDFSKLNEELKKELLKLTERNETLKKETEEQRKELSKNKAELATLSEKKPALNAQLNDLKVLKYKDKIVVDMDIQNYEGDFEVLELASPKRLVVELPNTTLNNSLTKKTDISKALLKSIRLGEENSKSRVVFDISDENSIPKYFVKKEKNLLKFTMLIEDIKQLKNILDIKMDSDENYSTVKVSFDQTIKYSLVRNDNDLAVVKFYGVKTPEPLQNTLDQTSQNSIVKMVSLFQSSDDSILAVKLERKGENELFFNKETNTLEWRFKNIKKETPVLVKKEDNVKYLFSETASYQEQGDNNVDIANKQYHGKRISIDFKNADIHDVLQLIADVSKVNIITSDDVTGTVTMKLRNVQWDKALDVILKTKSLGKEVLGNIIRVAPQEILTKEYQAKVDLIKKREENVPLGIRLIPVNYAHADELLEQVKGLLSPRGKVSVDARTNVLIVKDTFQKLDESEALVRNLDTQTPQVLIEGRIVEAESSFSTEQGIEWGGGVETSSQYGTQTGLIFPSSIGLTGGLTSDRWITNLPAAGAASGGGGLNFSLGSINDSISLNFRITAAEAQGMLKIISSPRISTLDNKEAIIETGLKLPIITINEQGTPTTKLIDAKIKLTVKPHVTSDGSVILKMELKKEEPDFSRKNSLGDPAIISKSATTELLIKDGQTAVIGGMYTKKTSDDEKRVPFFGSIPVLGWFFKNTQQTDTRSELLIFITPRIINKDNGLISK
ncbi:type IV pilus secretin PilQ [bacterium]|nr:type IV pilus secretin PilQ [bacterium]